MPSEKKKYMLVATCLECGFSMSNQIESEPVNLTQARLNFGKLVASTHPVHPDLGKFNISAREQ
jgi:hypothetical protein